MSGYGYGSTRSSKSSKGYGSGIGYSAGKKDHTNAQKAIFHGLKAARRWAVNGQYQGAAYIAKLVSECWVSSRGVTVDLPDMRDFEEKGELTPSRVLVNELKEAERHAKAGRHTDAARTAWPVAAAYLDEVDDDEA